MFGVYKAHTRKTNQVYYGYFSGATPAQALSSFIKSSYRRERTRGAPSLVDSINGDRKSIKVDVLAVYSDEVSAFDYRNIVRDRDLNAITGPSSYPIGYDFLDIVEDFKNDW